MTPDAPDIEPAEHDAPSKVQLAYAKLLSRCARIALVVLVITFGIYVAGVFSPSVGFDELPTRWTMSAREYAAAGGATGWGWVSRVGYGDYLNYVGIALLASVTTLCYLRVLPMLVRQRDFLLAGIAVAEVLVLVLAASGIVRSGGH